MVLTAVDIETGYMTFEDLKEEYPLRVVAQIIDGFPSLDGAELGKGYKCELFFEKGERIENEAPTVDEDFAWGKEATETTNRNFQYEPDRLMVKPIGIVKGMEKAVSTGAAKKAPAKKGAPASNLDF